MMTPEEFREKTEATYRLHTKQAPGIPIAIAMIDLAREKLGPIKEKLNAVAETQACLSDALQIAAGCTVGNRYLRVLPSIGRYALTLFDRADGRGIRVSVDLEKLDPKVTPELCKFFHRARSPEVNKGGPAREASGQLIIAECEKVGYSMFKWEPVQIVAFGKPPMLPAVICPDCGESFLQREASHVRCDVCTGSQAYYRPMEVVER